MRGGRARYSDRGKNPLALTHEDIASRMSPSPGLVPRAIPKRQAPPKLKVLLVGSSGGHLDQLLLLDQWLRQQEVVVATFLKPDAKTRTAGWTTYGLHWPTNRSLRNLVRNTGVAVRVLLKERPDLVISSGAAGAVPFFYLAKPLCSAMTIYIECFDRIKHPT